MLRLIDSWLDRVTMYRLLVYVLLGDIAIATILAYFGRLPYTPLAVLVSTGFLCLMCWAANTILARIFAVPTNVESAAITGLILSLILDPARTPDDLQLLGWAAILAMASKYLLSIHNKHLFNPAAIAVVITAFALGEPASWWVGTAVMMPSVLLGGWLVVRKTRQEAMLIGFLVATSVALITICFLQSIAFIRELQLLLLESPLIFFATIMLTEPLTAPTIRDLRVLYAVLIGVLFIPQVHIGAIYSTPELALVVGNGFAFLVNAQPRVLLSIKSKRRLAPNIIDFELVPTQPLAFAPGQYLECTLDHPHPDARGNRRYFTIASSPTEESVHLGVRFYQRSSSFKRVLAGAGRQTPLLGTQIAGDFTLPLDPKQKLVFIAGGIGITPFRSMLKYLVDTQQERDIFLIYANRKADEFVYLDVLKAAADQLGVKLMLTLTDTTAIPRNWSGYSGRITADLLRDVVPEYHERIWYISGPPEMVHGFQDTLKKLGIPGSHIKVDFFPGLV